MQLIAPNHILVEVEDRDDATKFSWVDERTGHDFHVEVMPDSVFLDRIGNYCAAWLTEDRKCVIRDRGPRTNSRLSIAHEYVHFLQDTHPAPDYGNPPKSVRSGQEARSYYLLDHEFYAHLVQDLLRMQDLMSDLPELDRTIAFRYFTGEMSLTLLFESLRTLHGPDALSHMRRVRRLEPSTFMLNLKWHHQGKWRHAVKKLAAHME
jgi:hypothetical protein